VGRDQIRGLKWCRRRGRAMELMKMGGGDVVRPRISVQCRELRGVAKTSPMMAERRPVLLRRGGDGHEQQLLGIMLQQCATNR